MVFLCIPPLTCWKDLGHDLAMPPLLICFLSDVLGYLLLLLIMVEDPTPVLTPGIRSLPVRRRGVVHLVKVLDQRAVADLGRVEDELARFGVCNILAFFP